MAFESQELASGFEGKLDYIFSKYVINIIFLYLYYRFHVNIFIRLSSDPEANVKPVCASEFLENTEAMFPPY